MHPLNYTCPRCGSVFGYPQAECRGCDRYEFVKELVRNA